MTGAPAAAGTALAALFSAATSYLPTGVLRALAGGVPVDPDRETPQSWRDFVRERTGELAPLYMTDGRDVVFSPFEEGYDPGNPVDRAIHATRTAVFPSHGIDPSL